MSKKTYIALVEYSDGREPLQEEFQAEYEFWGTNHDAQRIVEEKYGHEGYKSVKRIRLFCEINHRVDRGGYDH